MILVSDGTVYFEANFGPFFAWLVLFENIWAFFIL